MLFISYKDHQDTLLCHGVIIVWPDGFFLYQSQVFFFLCDFRWGEVTINSSLLSQLLPGPVTLIFKRTAALNPQLNPTHENVGIRVPDYGFVQAVARACGEPLALTSANINSEPSTLAVEVGFTKAFVFLTLMMPKTDYSGLFGQYHAHWCPGYWSHQGISRHGIDHHSSPYPFLDQGAVHVSSNGVGSTRLCWPLALPASRSCGSTPVTQQSLISVSTHSDHVFLGLPFPLGPGSRRSETDLIQDMARCTCSYHLSHPLGRTPEI